VKLDVTGPDESRAKRIDEQIEARQILAAYYRMPKAGQAAFSALFEQLCKDNKQKHS